MEWFEKAVLWILTTMQDFGIFIINKPWIGAIIIGLIFVLISAIIIWWKRR